jgi:phenylalanyl-tRNA synthetase beta chain
MICIEGIALNLNVFLERRTLPNFRLKAPPNGHVQTMIVDKATAQVRPLVSCAVLRNVSFIKARYESFIALQDKLHANLARNRTLVSIGTHDLDTIQGPFHYKALPPKDIKFIPLNQTKEMDAAQLMTFYEKDRHLGRYLHIIRDKPVYPVIYDSTGTVLSLPPIINGDHSKISENTKNIFIEITATDKTKVEIVNQVLVAMFSGYCGDAYTVEPVNIVSDHNGESRQTPDLTPREMVAEVSYLNACTGLTLQPSEQAKLLAKMGLKAAPSKSDPAKQLDVTIPINRADVLHQADIMEDLAIAYGFNKLPRHFPASGTTVSAPLPINKLSDLLRGEAGLAGWTEVMPLILCSHDENFAWLNRKDDGKTAARLGNPKSIEYQVVRTSLLPGLLKTLRENKHHKMPYKVFEVSDVLFKAPEYERKTRNERHLAAAWCGKTSGFEVVQGLMDRILLKLMIPFIQPGEAKEGYWIEELNGKAPSSLHHETLATQADNPPPYPDPTYFAGYAATIHLNIKKGTKLEKVILGQFGVLHPTVLKNFDLL